MRDALMDGFSSELSKLAAEGQGAPAPAAAGPRHLTGQEKYELYKRIVGANLRRDLPGDMITGGAMGGAISSMAFGRGSAGAGAAVGALGAAKLRTSEALVRTGNPGAAAISGALGAGIPMAALSAMPEMRSGRAAAASVAVPAAVGALQAIRASIRRRKINRLIEADSGA